MIRKTSIIPLAGTMALGMRFVPLYGLRVLEGSGVAGPQTASGQHLSVLEVDALFV